MSLNWKKTKQQSQISKNGHQELPSSIPKPKISQKKRKNYGQFASKSKGNKPSRIIIRRAPKD